MTFRPIRHPLVPSLLLVVTLVAFTGCDTTDPVEPADPIEVEGTYDFVTFRFVPESRGILAVNVLDTLNTDESFLQLAANEQFRLQYQFVEQTFPDAPRGDFRATRDDDDSITVELMPRQSDVDEFEAILLGSEVVFTREIAGGDTLLVLSEERTVDLAAYDAVTYGSVGSQPGTLTVELVLRQEGED
jgi:hypothetical protein